MSSLHHAGGAVKTPRTPKPSRYNPLAEASVVAWFKYHDRVADRQVVQAAGYSNGIACSDRTRAGKLHSLNGFNIRDNLLQAIERKYHTFLIRIRWKRSNRLIHYSIRIDHIRKVGTPKKLYDGLQWHIPLNYWSIDGAPPFGPEPVQFDLFPEVSA